VKPFHEGTLLQYACAIDHDVRDQAGEIYIVRSDRQKHEIELAIFAVLMRQVEDLPQYFDLARHRCRAGATLARSASLADVLPVEHAPVDGCARTGQRQVRHGRCWNVMCSRSSSASRGGLRLTAPAKGRPKKEGPSRGAHVGSTSIGSSRARPVLECHVFEVFFGESRRAAAHRFGFLASGSPPLEGGSDHNLAAFRTGVEEVGFVEGKDVVIDYKWARGQFDRLPTLASELVARPAADVAAIALRQCLADDEERGSRLQAGAAT
jgi:hypothetical protein